MHVEMQFNEGHWKAIWSTEYIGFIKLLTAISEFTNGLFAIKGL